MNPKCKYLLFGGAASGGKSYFLRWAAIGLGLYYYGKYGFRNVPIGLFSTDYPTLKDRQVIKIKNEIPDYLGEIKESRDEGFAFIGKPEYGSFIVLLRNLDDPSKYKSAEFASVLVEELSENTEDTFDDLRFRMRYKGIDEVKFIGATNPGGVGHGFVKRKWIKPDPEHADHEQSRFFYIPAKYSDNSYTNDEYVQQLKSLPENKRRAYMEGDWDIFAGQFFSVWRDSLHVCNPIIPNKQNPIVGGLDWGRVDNFSFHLSELSVVPNNGARIFRSKVFFEVYGKDKTVDEWVRIIKEKLEGHGLSLKDISWIRADTQIWSKSLDAKALDIYSQFVQADEQFRTLLKPANKDRLGGWENMQRWLSIAPDNLPYLQFTASAPNAIRVIPELIHDDNKVEDVDQKGENDAADSVRYLHMALKWMDSRSQAISHEQRAKKKLPIAPAFIDEKQMSLNMEAFSDPKNTFSKDGSVGAIRH